MAQIALLGSSHTLRNPPTLPSPVSLLKKWMSISEKETSQVLCCTCLDQLRSHSQGLGLAARGFVSEIDT